MHSMLTKMAKAVATREHWLSAMLSVCLPMGAAGNTHMPQQYCHLIPGSLQHSVTY